MPPTTVCMHVSRGDAAIRGAVLEAELTTPVAQQTAQEDDETQDLAVHDDDFHR